MHRTDYERIEFFLSKTQVRQYLHNKKTNKYSLEIVKVLVKNGYIYKCHHYITRHKHQLMKETYFPAPNRRHIRIHAFLNIYRYKAIEKNLTELSREKISEFLFRENIGIEAPLNEDELNDKVKRMIQKFDNYILLSHEERSAPKILDGLDLEIKRVFRTYNSTIFMENNKARDDIQVLRTVVNSALVSALSLVTYIADTCNDGLSTNNENQNLKIFTNHNFLDVLKKLRSDENYSRICIAYKTIWEDSIDMQNVFENLFFFRESKFESLENLSGAKILYKILKHIIVDEPKFGELMTQLNYWEAAQEMMVFVIKNLTTYLSVDLEPMDFNTFKNKCIFSNDSSIDVFYYKLVDEFLKNEKNIGKNIAEKLDKWVLERLSLVDRLLITMGVVEMKCLTGIPHQVAINEYIEIGKIYGGEKSAGFINGILDKLK